MAVRNRFAFIVPRFGRSIGGGAETLMRSLALQLNEDVEVWTTCAKDHRTWANEHKPGESIEDGICVRRFPVDARDVDVFLRNEFLIADGKPLTIGEQLAWLGESVNSRALYEHIARYGQEFDALFFAPYLFPTSFWGPLIHPSRSVLIPCLHNENYAYLEVFKYLFNKVAGLMFNANAEGELAKQLYGPLKSGVVGMGFEENSQSAESISLPEKFIVYSGRKERGKNLYLLLDYFADFRSEFSQDIKLVLIGSGELEGDVPEGVIDLGFVTEGQKRFIFQNALALAQLSTNESFSIVMMESWLEGTPIIVNSNCAVTREHVVDSSGGLFVSSSKEFAAVLEWLLKNENLRRQMGENGRHYVLTKYSWRAVIDRFYNSLCEFGLIKWPEKESLSSIR